MCTYQPWTIRNSLSGVSMSSCSLVYSPLYWWYPRRVWKSMSSSVWSFSWWRVQSCVWFSSRKWARTPFAVLSYLPSFLFLGDSIEVSSWGVARSGFQRFSSRRFSHTASTHRNHLLRKVPLRAVTKSRAKNRTRSRKSFLTVVRVYLHTFERMNRGEISLMILFLN